MIAGIFHKGSGLGNQLHRYVATRVLAMDKGCEFGMVAPELFKGKDFMNLDMGKDTDLACRVEEPSGKVIPRYTIGDTYDLQPWEEWNKNVYDPDINFVEDGNMIDGNFEDPKYFEHRLQEVETWLKTDYLEIPNDVCLIGFRGGEYYTVPELGLPKEYYDRATEEMLKINPNFKFEVHTDDVELAKQFFPNYPVIRDISINWRAMRYAKYAIIANSSFYVLPRLLRHHDDYWKNRAGGAPDIGPFLARTIAPRYWNRYNIRKWEYPQNYYKQFRYI